MYMAAKGAYMAAKGLIDRAEVERTVVAFAWRLGLSDFASGTDCPRAVVTVGDVLESPLARPGGMTLSLCESGATFSSPSRSLPHVAGEGLALDKQNPQRS